MKLLIVREKDGRRELMLAEGNIPVLENPPSDIAQMKTAAVAEVYRRYCREVLPPADDGCVLYENKLPVALFLKVREDEQNRGRPDVTWWAPPAALPARFDSADVELINFAYDVTGTPDTGPVPPCAGDLGLPPKVTAAFVGCQPRCGCHAAFVRVTSHDQPPKTLSFYTLRK